MNKKLILILILIPIVIILSGITLGFLYSSLPGNNPQRDRSSCESIYGEWVTDESRCLLSYKKAGQACIDGGQCESGVCYPPALTEDQLKMLDYKKIENITGTCYPESEILGCVEQVLGGTISKESMCLAN